jgi:hypothetical protein
MKLNIFAGIIRRILPRMLSSIRVLWRILSFYASLTNKVCWAIMFFIWWFNDLPGRLQAGSGYGDYGKAGANSAIGCPDGCYRQKRRKLQDSGTGTRSASRLLFCPK